MISTSPIIENGTRSCRDCYRCIRSCPVHAIRVTDGMTYVEEDRCIQCSACVTSCHQRSKVVTSDKIGIRQAIADGRTVFASVDSSYAGAFIGPRTEKVPDALRRLGFTYAEDTADSAELMRDYIQSMQIETGIMTNCPATVNYIEKYAPDLIDCLLPVASPNIIHARQIRAMFGEDCVIVSIVQCPAKISEARRPEFDGLVDYAITFQQLLLWMAEEGIRLDDCKPSAFDELCLSTPRTRGASLTPLEGGALYCAGYTENSLTDTFARHISCAGRNVIQAIRDARGEKGILEITFCDGACMTACGMPYKNESSSKRWDNVIRWAKQRSELPPREATTEVPQVSLSMRFAPRPIHAEKPDEKAVAEVLQKLGRTPDGKLFNCGSCGYPDCHSKAVAVLQGMAEVEMCLPHIRAMSKKRLDHITEALPCGVLVVDRDLRILDMNPAFREMFFCNDSVIGRHVSYLLPTMGYENVMVGEELCEGIRTKYGVKYKESIRALPGGKQIIGIYTNLNNMRMDSAKLEMIQNQILDELRQLRERELNFAADLARQIGRSTADNERRLTHYIDLLEGNVSDRR